MSSLRVGKALALCAALAAWAVAPGCGRLGYDATRLTDGDDQPTPPDGGVSDAATGADAPPPGPDASTTPDAAGTGELALTTDPGDSSDPVIAYTGDGYSVVWSDTRNASNDELYLQRVVAGAATGGNVRLTSASGYSGFPSLAWNGTELGVGWEDSRLGTSDEVYFARFDKAGGAISTQVPLSNAAGRAYDPCVVWTGDGFGVAWEDGGGNAADLYFVNVDPAAVNPGVPVRRTSVAGASELASLAWTGSELGLAWEDARSGGFEIQFGRMSSSGVLVGTDPPPITSSSDAGHAFSPSLAWNGTSEYAVVFEDNRSGSFQVYMTFLLADGSRAGADLPLTTGADATESSLVWADDHWAVAYLQNSQVFLLELPALPTPPIPAARPVSSAGNEAASPSLVWTGAAYGIAWQDFRAGNWDIYFREVLP